MGTKIRVGSANAGGSVQAGLSVDYRLQSPAEALEGIDRSLEVLEAIVHRAGEAGCDVLAFPEDTYGLMRWQGTHPETLGQVLPEAVARLLQRLGGAAARYGMYLICCVDALAPGGALRNSAFFLGRDGREIGRYHKVNLPLHEQHKQAGDGFPVYQTPDLGGVGMLICYDMVFPEPARCLALNGADVIFCLTMGGAAFGGEEISRAAFRTRAVENWVYLVVSWGGGNERTGSMIVSPQGEILVDERRPGAIAIADIDPFDGRQAADFANWQNDMRARSFRERRPEAYGVLTAAQPPALDRLPMYTPAPALEIARIFSRATTVGHVEYDRAQELVQKGEITKAIEALEALRVEYPGTWFDRMASEQLAALRTGSPAQDCRSCAD
jgi:predicted amidohydrolase